MMEPHKGVEQYAGNAVNWMWNESWDVEIDVKPHVIWNLGKTSLRGSLFMKLTFSERPLGAYGERK